MPEQLRPCGIHGHYILFYDNIHIFSQFIGFKIYHIVLLIITVDYCELKAILQHTVQASFKL